MENFPFIFENKPVLTLLQNQPVLTLFVMLGLGYLIGNIRIGSFSLGPVAGVLFMGLFLGHFGFQSSEGAISVGFALFIFSVGYQAGPRFFDVLRTDGLRYLSLAFVIAATGFGLALAFATLFSFEPGTAAGLLAGGLTSSPTLAAAQEAVRSGGVSPPSGWSADQMLDNITTGYSITYIFGLAGLIAVIKLLPGLLGIDLQDEAKGIETEDEKHQVPAANVQVRTYRIRDESLTRVPVKEIGARYWDGFSVATLHRDGKVIHLDPDDYLELDDEISVLGDRRMFTRGISLIGEEVTGENGGPDLDAADVTILNREVVGKTLEQIDLARRYGVVLAGVKRMRMHIPLNLDFELRKGDVLLVRGPAANIDLLGETMGHVERDIKETDMITFSLGIAIGTLIGLISVEIGSIAIGLGSAGGLLASGLAVGFLRSVRPTFGRLPDAARWIFMEFGLLLFMAGVGLRAGENIVEVFLSAGPKLMLAGIFVTILPVVVGYLFGRKVLGLNPVVLLGAITGAMTSGASLSVVTKVANSSVPSLGYTGSYAFANVLLTICGSVILFL